MASTPFSARKSRNSVWKLVLQVSGSWASTCFAPPHPCHKKRNSQENAERSFRRAHSVNTS
eukprot:4658107-Amphidinium_carterae.2